MLNTGRDRDSVYPEYQKPQVVSVRELPHYNELLVECRKISEGLVRDAHWLLVLGYYRLGSIELRYEREGLIEREFGKATLTALAEDLHISVSNLYRAIQLAVKFPTERMLEEYKEACIRQGVAVTWTHFRINVLPDSTKQPQKYGGMETVADEVMYQTEALSEKVEKLKGMLERGDVSLEKKREVVGVLTQTAGVIEDVSRVLDPRLLPKPKTSRSREYLDFIKTLSCLVCGRSPCDPAHTETAGISIKGSDFLAIPLCRDHHNEWHRGENTFILLRGIDVHKEIIKCLVAYIEV